MNRILSIAFPLILALTCGLQSCSDKDDVRLPSDILGVWAPSDNLYLEFCDQNVIHKLDIEFQDNETIGIWTKDVYYYEPGYNLVIYLSGRNNADVFQIVKLSDKEMTWCPVDELKVETTENVGQLIGQIIKKAQEGYKLNPELYQYFRKISENQFLDILEELNIQYPWF